MIERIKELAVRSGVVEAHVDWEAAGGNLLEKFAELIIQECAEIGDGYDDESTYNYDTQCVYTAGMEIRKHFGVE